MEKKGESGYDPLYKIRPFLTQLINNFQINYSPSHELSVDEAMVSFKGRVWFMQYMPKKPNKWGMKAYSLADSKNGYTYNWMLYAGMLKVIILTQSNYYLLIIGKDDTLDLSKDRTVTQAVVMRLLKSLKETGHHIYMDNYYTSPNLFLEMKLAGFGACGIASVDRKGMPAAWKSRTGQKKNKVIMNKGEVRTENLGNGLLALQWKDKQIITMLSTIHDDKMVTKSRRSRSSTTGKEDVQKPVMVDAYNNNMRGVDKSDQLLAYYGFNHRTIKWYKRAIFHLFDLAIINAFILYKLSSQENKHLTHL